MTGGRGTADSVGGGIGTLLGVWAHPDDEAYLSSGLMAEVRRAGGRVVVATATRGEHGTDDPETWPPERLAPHREQELSESLAIVGVHEHRWLPHRDGALAGIPLATGAAGLVSILAEVRPDTIVTTTTGRSRRGPQRPGDSPAAAPISGTPRSRRSSMTRGGGSTTRWACGSTAPAPRPRRGPPSRHTSI